MRQSYTPIFHSTVNTRIWALSPAARCVWLWLHLSADPEGFVCATVAGVAVGANVDVGDARRALEGFEDSDPDALPDDAHQGRVIERVPRGWRVLGFEELRDLARYQARKARQRRYMKVLRDERASNDVTPAGSPIPTVTPTKTKTKTKTKPVVSEDNNPPTPQGHVAAVSINAMPELWEPSDELRSEAIVAGVGKFDEHLARLRQGPIGGTRGIFPSQLEGYIRGMFGRWRTWEETDRARAVTATKRNGSWGKAPVLIEPTAKHRAYAKKHTLPLDELVRELERSGAIDDLGAKRALEMLGEKMSRLVRERTEGAAA